MPPARAMPSVRSVVATGRRMKGSERLLMARGSLGGRAALRRPAPGGDAALEAVEVEVDDRGREQRQELRQDESTHDRDAERMAQLRSRAGADHQGARAEE